MTNTKSTKRALLTSVMALLLCFTMLLGTTYAWFTDSATSSSNVIKSGTLDIKMSYLKHANFSYYYERPDDAMWIDVESDEAEPIFNYDRWEPGYTGAAYVKIENKGNLALRYGISIVPTGEVGKLAEVIDVYYQIYYKSNKLNNVNGWNKMPTNVNVVGSGVDGASGYDKTMVYAGTLKDFIDGKVTLASNQELDPVNASFFDRPQGMIYYAVALHMREDAGNEYQNQSIGDAFDIRLVATQNIGETDSIPNNNMYDAGAEYAVADGVYVQEDGSLKAVSQEALSSVAELASKDDTITSVIYNDAVVPVVRDTDAMNAELAAGKSTIVLTEGAYTIGAAAGKTVTIAGTETTKIDVTSGLTYVRDANITFEGLTIQSAPEGAGYTNGLADATNTVFNNCVINGTLGLDYSCEFNNCEFNISGDYYNVWTWGAGTASFTDCTFNCDGKALLVYANVLDNGTSHQTVNITNCVFNDNGNDTVTGKAAIEITDTYPANNITYDVIINNTTVNGFSVTEQNATTFGGTDLGTNVWGNKNLLTTDDLNVVIDGVDVH